MNGHAELEQVWPRDGRLRLVGRLHGHDAAPGGAAAGGAWALRLELREGDGRCLHYPTALDGSAFDVSLPVDDLAPEGIALPAYWDAYLVPDPSAPAPRLRVGRLLDDIRGKKRIMVFPGQPVTGSRRVLVKPYYTLKDNLSVEVRVK
ncbi:hypothetical protein [Streptomyces sp. URMC 129]|uniref:hypothetical protein n=1 Tax=Streptomyces sp. URMC 129 TaxID=3423407 RepID=UPI003F197C49